MNTQLCSVKAELDPTNYDTTQTATRSAQGQPHHGKECHDAGTSFIQAGLETLY